jgi:predicted nucleic acid-binding protein
LFWTLLSRCSGSSEDETDRQYSLNVLTELAQKRASVPVLWFYEVGNALLMANRRKRIDAGQIDGFLSRLKNLPIDPALQTPSEILELPALARAHSLTNYAAAYLSLAMQSNIPLATTDTELRQAAAGVGVQILQFSR